MKKFAAKKGMLLAAGILAASVMSACGDDNKKAYLDEIKAEEYVEVGEYKGIEISQTMGEITNEYVDTYINYSLTQNPPEGVEDGDTVNIDYVGTKDGVAFEGGTAYGQNLTIGSGRFIPGFEEGLVGAKTGETVELPLTFPEDYQQADLAGEEVIFTVTVNAITAAEPQELTDEFVKGLGLECQTVDEYRKYVYDELYAQEKAAYEQSIEQEAVVAVTEQAQFKKEPPQALVDRYANTLTSNLTLQAQAYGLTLEQFMQLYYGMDAETYPEEIKMQALNTAKQYLVIQAIADKENLNVSEEEADAELQEMSTAAGYESLEEYKEAIDAKGYKEYIMSEKVLDVLRENAVVSEESAEENAETEEAAEPTQENAGTEEAAESAKENAKTEEAAEPTE